MAEDGGREQASGVSVGEVSTYDKRSRKLMVTLSDQDHTANSGALLRWTPRGPLATDGLYTTLRTPSALTLHNGDNGREL